MASVDSAEWKIRIRDLRLSLSSHARQIVVAGTQGRKKSISLALPSHTPFRVTTLNIVSGPLDTLTSERGWVNSV